MSDRPNSTIFSYEAGKLTWTWIGEMPELTTEQAQVIALGSGAGQITNAIERLAAAVERLADKG